jgi:pyochelin biosynthesis protein PchD
MPDGMLGERVCAFVVPRQPAPSALKLKRYLVDHGLAQFKVPDRIELVDSFPQTGIGKISKKDLRQHLRQSLEVQS